MCRGHLESYVNARGKAKTRTIKFNGVFVDGVGYGVVTSKGSALGKPVTIR